MHGTAVATLLVLLLTLAGDAWHESVPSRDPSSVAGRGPVTSPLHLPHHGRKSGLAG